MNKSDANRSPSAEPALTRRGWARTLAVAPFAAPLMLPQIATTPQNPPPPSAPASSDQQLSKAIDGVRKVSSRLAQTEVPMNVEPAFSFRA